MTDETAAPTPPEELKKPELIDRVVALTGLKKRDVKPAVEAALAVLAEDLAAERTVMLPPLGKLRVAKTRALDNGGAVLTVKLRQTGPAQKAATSPLATVEDEG